MKNVKKKMDDGIHLRVAAKDEQIIVVAEQTSEGGGEEEIDDFLMIAHERLKFLEMHSEIAADDEDEDVMQHPVVEAIKQEALEHGIFHAVDHRVERDVEA